MRVKKSCRRVFTIIEERETELRLFYRHIMVAVEYISESCNRYSDMYFTLPNKVIV